MKMKRICACIMAVLTSLSCMGTAWGENKDSNVEITFRVGDDTLMINGSSVQVEKPFVAGEGTTLVPLRVITEAFGAAVDWEDATRKITLTYPDVSIVLQIDNQIAQVNDHAEKLAEAPVLVNTTTMVPLRFISETFGATVSYDEATEGITVKKETETGNETVKGMTDCAKTGDSYYGWIMDTPKDFIMIERGFDGSYTYFEDSIGNCIDIDIYESDEEMTFDEYFSEIKGSFSGVTLVKADKVNNEHMHFQAKNEGEFYDLRVWRGDKYDIVVDISLSAECSEEKKTACLALADSFKMNAVFDENVYDLSDVEDGFRTFESEEYKVSFKVPADYYQSKYGVGENEMLFIGSGEGDAMESIHMSVYSKSETVTAEILARGDRDVHYGYANKELVTVTEPAETEINGIRCIEYSKSAEGATYESTVMRDIFFDLGEYVYNFAVVTSKETDETVADTIIGSMKVEELDFDETGTMLRNYPEDVDKKVKTDAYSLSINSKWQQMTEALPTGVLFSNISAESVIGLNILYNGGVTDAGTFFRNYIKEYKKTGKAEEVVPVKTVTLGKNKYYKSVLKCDRNEMVFYETVYFRAEKNTAIVLSLTDGELYYGGNSATEAENLLKSLELY